MNMGLAPRPDNEELRAQTVVKTGLIDAPNPDLFQIYCDLAKDITGFETASFSLYDGEMKCSIAQAGGDNFEVGAKSERSEFNVCSYVLLDTEPLLMADMCKDPTWKDHPHLEGMDTGPILAQTTVPVLRGDNEQTLSERVKIEEHRLYPRVLDWIAEGNVTIKDGTTHLDIP